MTSPAEDFQFMLNGIAEYEGLKNVFFSRKVVEQLNIYKGLDKTI